MVKIKRKVEVTQEEYAKYMIDKYGVSGFESSLIDDNIIDAPKRLTLVFEINSVSKSDLFNGSFRNGKLSVEVEEEITEDTEFEHLIEVTKGELHIHWSDSSVAGQITPISKEFHAYIDGEYKLIWTKENGLVE